MSISETPELRNPRPRRYVAPWVLTLVRPFVRHSSTRDAYVLKAIGNTRGPVLRYDRRRQRRTRPRLITD